MSILDGFKCSQREETMGCSCLQVPDISKKLKKINFFPSPWINRSVLTSNFNGLTLSLLLLEVCSTLPYSRYLPTLHMIKWIDAGQGSVRFQQD